jgi:hypothetical protein
VSVPYDVTLERRIRELCVQAIGARDAEQVQLVLSELRDALRQHTEQLKTIVADYPFSPVDVEKILPPSNGTQKSERKKKAT